MNGLNTRIGALLLAPLTFGTAMAQCPAGELEVTIEVLTDNYGNETYWQLVENGNSCGDAPIFTGGNMALNCNSGGGETSPNGGYPNNSAITTGPWCLTEGAEYDIISIDSWGDGQASFAVYVEGGFAGLYSGEGGLNTHTFTVLVPAPRDMALMENMTGFFCEVGTPVKVAGIVQNLGGESVTSFGMAYSIDGGPEQSITYSGLDLAPGDEFDFLHDVPWMPTSAGTNMLNVRITGVNGDTDLNNANDQSNVELTVNAEVPDIVEQFFFDEPIMTVIANADDDILVPRDLDFHPDRSRNELWVINKDVFNTGGSTVKFTNPGETGQTFQFQRDPAARHFMSLPTGIAMGDNNNFSTSPGVFDANGNQSTNTPFTGITLWSADPQIYAQNQFGPLGSHLDMLHVTPKSQGIAHERWNRYWVVDGFNQDIAMHDFRIDHGPGADFHGNAYIHRYPEVSITRDPNDHIVSHCVVDKRTDWLYVVDHGGQRVLRLDTRSGTRAGAPDFGPFEQYYDYQDMSGAIWEVVISGGLIEPAGIDVIGSHLLVSDHSNGEIIAYDMNDDFAEIGRISTGAPGIMGIKVGPDGSIWYVNATNSTLVRLEPALGAGISELGTSGMRLFPNPSSDRIQLSVPTGLAPTSAVQVLDATGRLCMSSTVSVAMNGLDIQTLDAGTYSLVVPGAATLRFIVSK